MTPLARYLEKQRKRFQAYIEKHEHDIPGCLWGTWLSRVKLLDIEFIKKWNSKNWNRYYLTTNDCISREEKLEHPDVFDVEMLVETYEEFLQFVPTCQQNLFTRSLLSKNDKNIVLDVERYPRFGWDWEYISCNPNITEEFVLRHLSRLNLEWVSSNKAISIEFIKRLSYTNNLPPQFYAKNPNLNETNFLNFFSKRQLKQVMNELTENEGISLNFILSRPDLGWNTDLVSYRSDITEKHILAFPDYNWQWDIISGCTSIDKNFLRTHPKVLLDVFFKQHGGLTVEEIEHLEPVDICENTLSGTLYDKANFLRRYYACRKIEDAFFNCYWDYSYEYCKRRLNRRYDELFA